MTCAGCPYNRGMAAYLIVILLLSGAQLLTACSAPTRAKVVSREQPAYKTQGRPSRYTVRKHDTLYTIAWNYGLEFQTLASWNGIAPPYTIYPGQTLSLSGPAKRSRSVVQSTTRKPPTVASSAARPPIRSPSASTSNKSTAETRSSGKVSESTRRLYWSWPTKGRLEQRYSDGDPTRKGIIIAGSRGQPVLAAESGRVVYAGSGLIGYGLLIIIKHNKNYLSAYGHNRKLLVKEGATVKKGMQVAEMGQKGAGNPVLHFEIRRNGTPVDPLKLLPRRP